MKCSIIGSGSFLGSHIYSQLKQINDYEIVTIGRGDDSIYYSYPENNLGDLAQLLLDSDVIIYCAGAGIQPGHSDTKQMIFGLNTFEPYRLLKVLEQNRFKGQVITFGSYFELGSRQLNSAVSESELIQNLGDLPNDYCRSKKYLTNMVRTISHSLNHVHMILTNVYGVGENEKRLMPYLYKSLKNKQTVNLTSGTQIRQYTHVEDIASYIVKNVLGSQKSGIFNFSEPTTRSVRSVVDLFFDLFNNRYGSNYTPIYGELSSNRDTSMEFLALDSSLVFQSFGKASFKSLSQGLEEYFE